MELVATSKTPHPQAQPQAAPGAKTAAKTAKLAFLIFILMD